MLVQGCSRGALGSLRAAGLVAGHSACCISSYHGTTWHASCNRLSDTNGVLADTAPGRQHTRLRVRATQGSGASSIIQCCLALGTAQRSNTCRGPRCGCSSCTGGSHHRCSPSSQPACALFCAGASMSYRYGRGAPMEEDVQLKAHCVCRT